MAKKPGKPKVFELKARRNETEILFAGLKSVSTLIQTLLQGLRSGHSHPFVD